MNAYTCTAGALAGLPCTVEELRIAPGWSRLRWIPGRLFGAGVLLERPSSWRAAWASLAGGAA